MAVEIRVPSSGESVVEATVGRWLKQPGQAVSADEDVVELETDKANQTVPAGATGVLQAILRQTGDTVGINDVLGIVSEGASLDGLPGIEQIIDKPGPSNGATTPGPTNGATTPGTSPNRIIVQTIDTPAEEPPVDPGVRVTPVAQRMLDTHGLKASEVRGTGPNGQIIISDVQNYLATFNETVKEPATPLPPNPGNSTTIKNGGGADDEGKKNIGTGDQKEDAVTTPRPPIDNPLLSEDRREVVEPMTRLRKTIARRLVEAQQTAAMLTTFNEVDMTAIMEVRKRRKDSFKEKHGVGLGFMSFFTKAVIGALKAHPYLNAEINGDNIIKKQYYDIGIAVGTERGLVVPVVRNADKLTFAGIEKAIGDAAGKARANTLTMAELTGGTFTITNGGVYGSLMSTPILNTPQVGILGMHKIENRPMAVNGQVVILPMMYLALSYDHRIVDGSEAVRFLVRVKELLEDPESLLLEG